MTARPGTGYPAARRMRAPQIFCVMGIGLMLGFLLYIGRGIVVPVIYGLLITVVITAVAAQVRALPLSRRLPHSVSLWLSALLIGGALAWIAGLLATNVSQFIQRAPQYQATLLSTIQTAATALGIEREPSWQTLRQDMLARINLQALLQSVAGSALSIIGGVVIVGLNVAFLLLERGSFQTKLSLLFADPDAGARVGRILAEINGKVGRYLAVKTLINVALGAISWAIMAAWGLEFALFWAILIGLVNYIPYLGTFIGVAFPVLMAVVQFGDVGTVLSLTLALSAAQFGIGNVVEPQIMGKSLNVSPFVILVALTVWGSLWGLSGAILAVPMTAAMVIAMAPFATTRAFAILLSQDGAIGLPAPVSSG